MDFTTELRRLESLIMPYGRKKNRAEDTREAFVEYLKTLEKPEKRSLWGLLCDAVEGK